MAAEVGRPRKVVPRQGERSGQHGERCGGSPWESRRQILTTAAVLTCLFAVLRWPYSWTGNEEHYFLLGHRLVAPAEYSAFRAAFDQSRGKWFGLAALGILVELLGMEAAHKLVAVLSIVATALALAALARMLALSVAAAATAVLLFLGFGQSVIGGEWFIGAVETKTFAYATGIGSVAAAGAGRIRTAAALVAIAAYFHFLIGVMWAACTAVFIVSGSGKGTLSNLKSYLTFSALLLAPLVSLLLMDVVEWGSTQRPLDLPEADYIYSIVRAPHHVAPFSAGGGWPASALGVGALGGLLSATSYALLRRTADANLRAAMATTAMLGIWLPAAVLLSWFDRHTGSLGKLYLFRAATSFLLLSLFIGAAVIDRGLRIGRSKSRIWLAALGASAAYFAFYREPGPWGQPERHSDELISAVQRHTHTGDIVLVDPLLDGIGALNVSHRRLDRPTVVSWKFVPAHPEDLYRWYRLIQWRAQVFERGCTPTRSAVAALVVARSRINAGHFYGREVYRDAERAVVICRTR